MALYHSAKGSVNYEVVGNPTIVDGVVSGFSRDNNFLKTILYPNTNFSLNGITICTKIKISSSLNSGSAIHWVTGISGGYSGGLGVSNKKLSVRLGREDDSSNYISITSDFTIQNDIWYWEKVVFINGTATFSYSTDGISYSTIGTANYTNALYFFQNRAFGIGHSFVTDNTYDAFINGSIDLNETYIMVNGQPWFGVCPVEVKKHQIKGPVGYTKVGSPTITDGVASGFSSSSYFQLAAENHPTIAGAKYELFIKFTTPATVVRNGICGSSYSYAQGGVWIDGAKKLISNVTTNLATRNLYFSSSALTGSTTYYAHLILDSINNDYRALLSTDKTNWTTTYLTLEEGETISSQAVTSVFRFGYNGDSSGGQFDGSIDLNETYIKVNGKLWYYQPAPTKYIIKDNSLVFASQDLYLSGPVNYTVVGSPTIVDGVVSDLSTANYLQLGGQLNLTGSDYEIVIPFNTGSYSTNLQLLKSSDGTEPGRIVLNKQANAFQFYVTWSDVVNFTYVFLANTDYAIKIKKEGLAFTAYLSESGGSFVQKRTQTFSSLSSQVKTPLLGYQNSGYIFDGSIDLKETYIKVNGNLWFYGKNYATKNIAPVPAGFTYGTTTTPSIGYVDMRTQAFTAAPSGATIGRDE